MRKELIEISKSRMKKAGFAWKTASEFEKHVFAIPIEGDTHEITYDDILAISNSEAKARMMVLLGVNNMFEDMIKAGKAELLLEPVDENDYQNARIWKTTIDVQGRGVELNILECVNATPEPNYEKLPVSVRNQLVDGKYKKYYLNIENKKWKTVRSAWISTFHVDDSKAETVDGCMVEFLTTALREMGYKGEIQVEFDEKYEFIET